MKLAFMQVYMPAQDFAGLQKAALQQVMQFLVALCGRHEGDALTCGAASVLAELAAIEHSLVTESPQAALQLAWAAGAFHGDVSAPAQGHLSSCPSRAGAGHASS